MNVELWLLLCGTLIAAASAVFAFVQAKAATDERKEAASSREAAEAARDESLAHARESAAASRRQADALETANQHLSGAQQLQERLAPSVWSQVRHLGRTGMAFDNQTGSHVIVTAIEANPASAQGDLDYHDLPFRVENGDVIGIRRHASIASPVLVSLRLTWHFEDEPGTLTVTERNV